MSNSADIGAKNSPLDRHVMLLHLLGLVDGGNAVGESVFLAQKQQEFNKRSIRSIKSMFVDNQDHCSAFRCSSAHQGMYAKQILRIAVAQTALALCQAMDVDEPNTQPLEPVVESDMFSSTLGNVPLFAFCVMKVLEFVISVRIFCFMVNEPDPEDADEESGIELDERVQALLDATLFVGQLQKIETVDDL